MTAADLDNAVEDLPQPLATIHQAIHRLRSDITVTTGLDLPLWVYGPDPEDGHYEVGPGILVTYRSGEDPEAFLAKLADEQSQEVSETLASADRLDEARRWPRCPAHDHSLDPAVVDGTAVWRCCNSPTIRFKIRDL